MIVTSGDGVTLIGGGGVSGGVLKRCLARAPVLVAADGAAGRALDLGHVPRATIGDMDSLPPEVRARLPEASVHPIAEQDSTDFAKCLRSVEAPFFLATGFTGRRVDHTLAALSALVRHKGPRCVMVGEEDVIFEARGEITLTLPLGCRVSLYPMAQVSGRSEGLEWSIEGLSFAPDGQVGTSNRASARQVTLAFDGPGMLVLLPLAQLEGVLAALQL